MSLVSGDSQDKVNAKTHPMCGLPCAGSLGVLTRNMIGHMNTKALMQIQVWERERCACAHTCTHMHTNTSNLQFPTDLPIAVQYNEKDPFINGNWENRLLAQTNLYASGTGHFAQSNGIHLPDISAQISIIWAWCPPATTCTLTFTLIQVWPRHTCFISLSSITCNFPGAT